MTAGLARYALALLGGVAFYAVAAVCWWASSNRDEPFAQAIAYACVSLGLAAAGLLALAPVVARQAGRGEGR